MIAYKTMNLGWNQASSFSNKARRASGPGSRVCTCHICIYICIWLFGSGAGARSGACAGAGVDHVDHDDVDAGGAVCNGGGGDDYVETNHLRSTTLHCENTTA